MIPFSSEIKNEMTERRQDFNSRHPEIIYEGCGDLNHENFMSSSAGGYELAVEIANNSNLQIFDPVCVGRAKWSPFFAVIKKLVIRVAPLFIRLILSRQQKLNDLITTLAFRQAALEEQVFKLKRLQASERKERN